MGIKTSDIICFGLSQFWSSADYVIAHIRVCRFNMIFCEQSQLGKEELKSLLNNELNITTLSFTGE